MVRYRVRPDAVAENLRLVRAVYQELGAIQPTGLRYSTVQIDETAFVHFAVLETDDNPLDQLAAFRAFTAEIGDRCEEGPQATFGRIVSSYG